MTPDQFFLAVKKAMGVEVAIQHARDINHRLDQALKEAVLGQHPYLHCTLLLEPPAEYILLQVPRWNPRPEPGWFVFDLEAMVLSP